MIAATPTSRLDEIVGRYRAQIEQSADHALDAMEVDDDITPREFADLLRLRFSTGRPALPADWLPGR